MQIHRVVAATFFGILTVTTLVGSTGRSHFEHGRVPVVTSPTAISHSGSAAARNPTASSPLARMPAPLAPQEMSRVQGDGIFSGLLGAAIGFVVGGLPGAAIGFGIGYQFDVVEDALGCGYLPDGSGPVC